jgi:RNA polymerase sigma-70 factor (ECF subfamily)
MVDWDGIVSREGPGVWRTLYRLLGNRADAEDCFQETFLNAVTLWRRERIEYPHAMLQRLATMRALDRLRKRYRRAKRETLFEEDFDFAAGGPMPHQSAEASELSDRMRAALSHLPEKQATAFCLFHLDGWDYQQIAGHLKATPNAVGVLLHRARQKLQELLGTRETAGAARPDDN